MRTMGLVLLALSTTWVGCGGSDVIPPVPVSGKVTLNGKPVEDALVTFMSTTGGRSASGKTQKDGSFKLTTYKTGDGAVPDKYKITVAKVESAKGGNAAVDISDGNYGADYGAMMAGAATGNTKKLLKDLLPPKYSNPAESGLSADVEKGKANTFELDLK